MYALRDVRAAVTRFPSWSYIGAKRLQLEYRRTLVGSLWLVLGFGVTSTGIGVLLAELQGLPLGPHVAYVAFGFAIWNFISGSIIGGCNVFTQNRAMMLQLPLPRSAFVIAHVVKNLLLFVVNLVTAALIAYLFGWRPGLGALMFLPGILLCIPAAFAVTILMGVISTRIPDLSELTASVMRLSFFLTPIFWVIDPAARLSARGADGELPFDFLGFLLTWNPFTHFLELVRDPLLGQVPAALNWQVAGSLVVVLLISAFIALQVAGRRITYWL